MKHNAYVFCFLVATVAGLGGCSSERPAKDSKDGGTAPDKIQGKVQEVLSETAAADAALNAGGPSIYLWEGLRRYRLFFKTPTSVEPGKEYIAEGVFAQRVIDDIGDPDQGKNGYPLSASCDRVVKTAWPGLAFDVTDLHASVLCARIKRYPARPVFLVRRIRPVTSKDGSAGTTDLKKDVKAEEKDIPEVTVAAEKQKALLLEGPTVQTAPLWVPTGGTARCKLVIDPEGKISELETGAQLCESVPWSQFRYKPTVQRGRPVKVKTEVEVRFEPRK
jgi:hypothetical protein